MCFDGRRPDPDMDLCTRPTGHHTSGAPRVVVAITQVHPSALTDQHRRGRHRITDVDGHPELRAARGAGNTSVVSRGRTGPQPVGSCVARARMRSFQPLDRPGTIGLLQSLRHGIHRGHRWPPDRPVTGRLGRVSSAMAPEVPADGSSRSVDPIKRSTGSSTAGPSRCTTADATPDRFSAVERAAARVVRAVTPDRMCIRRPGRERVQERRADP